MCQTLRDVLRDIIDGLSGYDSAVGAVALACYMRNSLSPEVLDSAYTQRGYEQIVEQCRAEWDAAQAAARMVNVVWDEVRAPFALKLIPANYLDLVGAN